MKTLTITIIVIWLMIVTCLITFAILHYSNIERTEDIVKCYDGNNNEIIGINCMEIKETSKYEGIFIGLGGLLVLYTFIISIIYPMLWD